MENLIYTINFKQLALTNKITARDAAGNVVSYSHQKLLKIKEKVLFYTDQNQTTKNGEINADSVIDYNVKYTLTDSLEKPVYALRRVGRRSLWKAHYEIMDPNGQVLLNINEKNAMTKVLDTLVGEIPIIGLFTGYLFNAEYLMTDQNGTVQFGIKKKPSLLESNFEIYAHADQEMDTSLLQITTMAIMRERRRS